MTLYGYARVSIREPEDKNLDLQVEVFTLSLVGWAIVAAELALISGRPVCNIGLLSSKLWGRVPLSVWGLLMAWPLVDLSYLQRPVLLLPTDYRYFSP